MPIIFAGSAAFEFGNVTELSTGYGQYDPLYSLGSIQKLDSSASVLLMDHTPATEYWVHLNAWITDTFSGTVNRPYITLIDEAGDLVAGIVRAWTTGGLSMYVGRSGSDLTGAGSSYSINTVLTYNTLLPLDIHYYQQLNKSCFDLYQNGVLIGSIQSTKPFGKLKSILLAGNHGAANFYSEVVVTSGNEPTIGWRLHSKRPDPALDGLNTFDSGFWGSLANNSLEDGLVTTSPGARITGGFDIYTGTPTPIGIRGVVQSGRFIRNGTLLQLNGSLRIEDVNYDNPDYEFRDTSRVMSFWEINPATGLPFVVADFAGLQGGYLTAIE